MKGKNKLIWRLITLSVVVFFLLTGVYFVLTVGSDSKKLEQTLIDRYGWAGEYVPIADGSIPQDRLEKFILVRAAVQPSCHDYHQVLDGIVGLEAIETDENISGNEAASRGIKAFKSMIGVGPKMLQFMDARNTALFSQEMSIGEYIYIYLAAYSQELVKASSSPYAEMEEAYISKRIRQDYLQILGNQLAALDPAEPTQTRHKLEQEIRALEEGAHASPWPDGPLPMTVISLDPFREQLASLYCDGLVSIELLQKRRNLTFRK